MDDPLAVEIGVAPSPGIPFEERLLSLGVHRAVAVSLFEVGSLTLAQGAQVAGLDLEEFVELLGREGVAAVDYPAEGVAEELEEARQREGGSETNRRRRMKGGSFALDLRPSLLEEARRVAEEEGVAINQLINVAVAEKLSALRTEAYFRERAARGDVDKAREVLGRSGKGNPPVPGGKLPSKSTSGQVPG